MLDRVSQGKQMDILRRKVSGRDISVSFSSSKKTAYLRVPIPEADALEVEIPVDSEDMEFALRCLKRLNLWCFANGERVSRHITVDGFEPWWFRQEHLFWRIVVPFSRYRTLVHLMLNSSSVEIMDPPPRFLNLLRILVGQPHVPPIRIVCARLRDGNLRSLPGRAVRKIVGRVAYGIIVLFSAVSMLLFALLRPKVLLYTVDKVSPGLRHDFRLHTIYQELDVRGETFAEYVHIAASAWTALRNLFRRRRPALFFEYVVNAVGWLRRWTGGKRSRLSNAIAVDPECPDSISLACVAAYGLEMAERSALEYRVLKRMVRLQRPKYALIMDDSRYSHSLVAACKASGVFTLGYQHGLGLNKYFAGLACYGFGAARRHSFDAYGLWSEYFRRRLHSFSELYEPEDTFVFGSLRPPAADELEEALAKHIATENGRIRVLLISEPLANPVEVKPFVARLVSDERFSVALKLRPGEDRLQIKAFWGNIENKIQKVESPSVYRAFAKADVVIGMYSSVFYEAVLALKPVVVLDSTSPFAADLPQYGLAEFAESPECVCDVVLRASALPGEERMRRRNVVWGEQLTDSASRLFDVVETRL